MDDFVISREAWEELVDRVAALESQVEQTGELVKQSTEIEKPKAKRGRKLPDGYMPPDDVIDAIRAEFPFTIDADFVVAHREFCDYWIAIPGQRGVKLDWDATWRNWMRRHFQDRRFDRRRGGTEMSTVDAKIASMQARKDAE